MALRALLFSKNPETAASLAAMLGETGIRPEVCADIFSSVDKATKQVFPCIIVDWLDQPEAGFLLKRARESASNRSAIAIAIVDRELAAEEVRERQIDFLIYRPISADEARAIIAKARRRMQLQSASAPNLRAALLQPDETAPPEESEDPNLVSIAADLPEPPAGTYPPASSESEAVEDTPAEEPAADSEPAVTGAKPGGRGRLRAAFAVALLIVAALCLFRSRVVFRYLAHTPEGAIHVLRESVAALFFADQPAAQSTGSATADAQQDAYFARTSGKNANVASAKVEVVNSDITLPDTPGPLPRAPDLPLPAPVFEHTAAAPRTLYTKIPESLKSSAPISAPVVAVAVGPAQMGPPQVLPVSTAPPPLPRISEPVPVSEDAARALAVHTVAPVYPPEALAQKLQGAVVLQAVIGRDGSVEDLKILRGYFLLGRAAIAAVKQWRFRPYTLDGHPVQTQTVITLNFTYPPA